MSARFIKRNLIFSLQRDMSSVAYLEELRATTNTLIVYFRHEISDSQIYPFYFYRDQLKNKYGVNFQEISIYDLNLEKSVTARHNIKRIYFQHGFMTPQDKIESYLKFLSLAFPSAKIAFMDWFGPITLGYAEVADPYIDVYIKKQIFRNFDNYNQVILGDTNLSDYYGRRHQIDLPQSRFFATDDFEKKIRLWPNFYLSPKLVDLFLGTLPSQVSRPIDIHAHIAVNGCDWYKAMRQESLDAVKNLPGKTAAIEGRVLRHKFIAELRKSKLVFSPFGYGEVCWRDYEAFATGGLLLKPSMNHLKTFSEDFISGETYIEIPWDYEFISHKVEDCINNYDKFEMVRKQAFFNIQNVIKGSFIPDYIAKNFH